MEELMVEKATDVFPKLRFPQYAGPWKKGPIGKHIELVSGVALPGNEISEEKGGVAILRGINITEGNVRHSPDIDRYYHGSLEGIDHLLLKEGDLVLGMDGSKVGKNTAIISKNDEGSLLIQRVARIRPTGTASIEFIYHHIFSYRFHDYVDVVNTSSGIPHISGKQIRDFEVAFPTLPEQQKIAAFLGAVDRKIQQLKRKQALLEQYKKGVVQQLFSRELRFKKKDGGEFPVWEEKRLGDVGDTFNGLTGKAGEDFGEGKPFITYKQIFDSSKINLASCERVRVEDGENQVRVKKGDVFFTTSSETREEVGFASVLLDDVDEVYLNSFSFGYRIHSHKLLSPDFARFLFRSADFREDMIKLGQGSTRYNISKTGFKEITVQLPSLEEQTRIAGFLMALDAKVAGVAQEVTAAQRWKKGLLQGMFV